MTQTLTKARQLELQGGTSRVQKLLPIPFSEMESGWTSFYAGTFAFDTTTFLTGAASSKITTTAGTLSGARLVQGPTSFIGYAVRIRFRVSNWSQLSEFTIRLYTDAGATLGYLFNFRNYFSSPNNGEWYDVVIPRSEFELIGGATDWSTVQTLYLRATSSAIQDVWVDEISLVPEWDEPFVSVTFDDGYDTQYSEGRKYLDKYNYVATAFVQPNEIGTAGYMTEAQLEVLSDIGWGIEGHHATNLTTLTGAPLEQTVKNIKDWIATRSYRGGNHFAYPNGAYNNEVRRVVSKHFRTARTIDGFNQPPGYVIESKVNSRTISNATTTATIQGWIDTAQANNEWLILNFHKLVTTATVGIEYSIANFQTVVDYLYNNRSNVLPYHEVIARIDGGAQSTSIGLKAITATQPVPPPNVLRLFNRKVANRMLPAYIGASGLDSALQPFLARNKIGYWNPTGNATTVPGVFGITAPTVVGTATARNVATTNGATRMRRLGYVSVATAAGIAEARIAVAQFSAGSGLNDGSGFFYCTRFVPSNAATVTGERFFIGLQNATGAGTNVEPNTLTQTVGIAQLSTDATQFYLVYGGTTAQTAIALGTALGSPSGLSTSAYELAIFAPNSVANTFYIQVTNIFTGVTVSQTITGAAAVVPQSTTLLAHRAFKTNNATALAVGFDICSIYVETDT